MRMTKQDTWKERLSVENTGYTTTVTIDGEAVVDVKQLEDFISSELQKAREELKWRHTYHKNIQNKEIDNELCEWCKTEPVIKLDLSQTKKDKGD